MNAPGRTSVVLLVLLLAALTPSGSTAAPPQLLGTVRVEVSPDRPDWTYAVGQPAAFRIRVTRDGHPLEGVVAKVRLGPEKMPPRRQESAPVPAAGLVLEGETLESPGFLRCEAEVEVAGRTYRGMATAGFAPEQIKPTVSDPDDFDAFWAAAKKELAAVPMAAKVTPFPERSTATVEVFHVTLQNVPPRRPARVRDPGATPPAFSSVQGVLAVPRARGPFPAVLNVPGAGVRGYQGLVALAEKGFITLQIGIHGIPVNLEEAAYDGLRRAALSGYPTYDLDDRDNYYYRRVYLGAVRANDFLTQEDKWDRRNLYVMGGSQGGALSIVTAALDPRVKALVAIYPALSDLTGFLHGRAGGWPLLFRGETDPPKAKVNTVGYYDVVNFARRLRVPGFYSWGFNDETCPPTSMYAAYNVITAPKTLALALETGHNTTREQTEASEAWLDSQRRQATRTAPRRNPAGR